MSNKVFNKPLRVITIKSLLADLVFLIWNFSYYLQIDPIRRERIHNVVIYSRRVCYSIENRLEVWGILPLFHSIRYKAFVCAALGTTRASVWFHCGVFSVQAPIWISLVEQVRTYNHHYSFHFYKRTNILWRKAYNIQPLETSHSNCALKSTKKHLKHCKVFYWICL